MIPKFNNNQGQKPSEEEIEGLVKGAQKGDQESFAGIYDLFIDLIYRYVYYRVAPSEAEDLVENVFLKVWENIRQYKPKKRSFSAWVFRIAHNLIIDHYRASKNGNTQELDPRFPDLDREHNPIGKVQNTLDKEVLRTAISKLKKPYQEVIIHKYINEFSNKETAEILKKSEGSLRILQFRALKALKKELEDIGVKY